MEVHYKFNGFSLTYFLSEDRWIYWGIETQGVPLYYAKGKHGKYRVREVFRRFSPMSKTCSNFKSQPSPLTGCQCIVGRDLQHQVTPLIKLIVAEMRERALTESAQFFHNNQTEEGCRLYHQAIAFNKLLRIFEGHDSIELREGLKSTAWK